MADSSTPDVEIMSSSSSPPPPPPKHTQKTTTTTTLKCLICHQRVDKNGLESHIVNWHRVRLESFTCATCPHRTFDSLRDVIEHVRQEQHLPLHDNILRKKREYPKKLVDRIVTDCHLSDYYENHRVATDGSKGTAAQPPPMTGRAPAGDETSRKTSTAHLATSLLSQPPSNTDQSIATAIATDKQESAATARKQPFDNEKDVEDASRQEGAEDASTAVTAANVKESRKRAETSNLNNPLASKDLAITSHIPSAASSSTKSHEEELPKKMRRSDPDPSAPKKNACEWQSDRKSYYELMKRRAALILNPITQSPPPGGIESQSPPVRGTETELRKKVSTSADPKPSGSRATVNSDQQPLTKNSAAEREGKPQSPPDNGTTTELRKKISTSAASKPSRSRAAVNSDQQPITKKISGVERVGRIVNQFTAVQCEQCGYSLKDNGSMEEKFKHTNETHFNDGEQFLFGGEGIRCWSTDFFAVFRRCWPNETSTENMCSLCRKVLGNEQTRRTNHVARYHYQKTISCPVCRIHVELIPAEMIRHIRERHQGKFVGESGDIIDLTAMRGLYRPPTSWTDGLNRKMFECFPKMSRRSCPAVPGTRIAENLEQRLNRMMNGKSPANATAKAIKLAPLRFDATAAVTTPVLMARSTDKVTRIRDQQSNSETDQDCPLW